MFTLTSRYATQPVLEADRGDGVTVRYVLPRLLPDPGDMVVATRHRAVEGDRLDLLAWRHLGDPTAWWMIADANRVTHPAALPGAPGDTTAVPVPGTGKPGG
ncbi:MAG TPA: hypothetical protein PKD48_17590 [Sphingopyxis sp.]|mgnify:CR=1 FL=1|nr:hypothetical protein [Sphingopyxis sp.]HMQ17708.1 hypothetical protein [Sphingopyxis sp.]